MSQGELVPQSQEMAVQPTNLLQAITQASMNPALDIDKFERLLAMQERLEVRQRETSFMEALSRIQAKIPQIEKQGKVVVKGVERSRYAKLENIDTVVRPLLQEEGFAVSYDTAEIDAKAVNVFCKLSHKGGHFEVKSLPVPIDFNDFRSGSQSVVASVTLAKRHLLKMHLNIIEKDEDTDGNSVEKISEQEAVDLRNDIKKINGTEEGFLSVMTDVSRCEDVLKRDLKRLHRAITAKGRGR